MWNNPGRSKNVKTLLLSGLFFCEINICYSKNKDFVLK